MITDGLTTKGIGYQLDIADKSPEFHMRTVYRKIGVRSSAEATAFVISEGLA